MSEGYRALYEEDELNMSAMRRLVMSPSPPTAPPQRPPSQASLFTTPPPALQALGVRPPSSLSAAGRATVVPASSSAGLAIVGPTVRSPMSVAGEHDQDTPEERSYLPVCTVKSSSFVPKKDRFFSLQSLRAYTMHYKVWGLVRYLHSFTR